MKGKDKQIKNADCIVKIYTVHMIIHKQKTHHIMYNEKVAIDIMSTCIDVRFLAGNGDALSVLFFFFLFYYYYYYFYYIIIIIIIAD